LSLLRSEYPCLARAMHALQSLRGVPRPSPAWAAHGLQRLRGPPALARLACGLSCPVNNPLGMGTVLPRVALARSALQHLWQHTSSCLLSHVPLAICLHERLSPLGGGRFFRNGLEPGCLAAVLTRRVLLSPAPEAARLSWGWRGVAHGGLRRGARHRARCRQPAGVSRVAGGPSARVPRCTGARSARLLRRLGGHVGKVSGKQVLCLNLHFLFI